MPADTTSLLDEAIVRPGATGLLITSVLPDSQAANAGILPGDIVIAYAGQPTPDLPALNAAVAGAGAKIRLLTVRGTTERSVAIEKGRIGVTLIPVKKGEGREPLPAGNVKSFDFSSLETRERVSWFAFYRAGERCGYGRIRALLVGDRLVVMTEEVYEDSTRIYDHEVTNVTTAKGMPLLRLAVFRDRMNDWERFGSACACGENEFLWTVVSRGPGSEEEAFQTHIGTGVVPAYMLETLASFMPRKRGACLRFLPLFEGSGRVALPSALVCLKTENVTTGGKTAPAWRFEWRTLDGATNAVYWLDGSGRVVRADYGDIHVERSTADDVKEGQPESILSR
jgi:hypothetical protein